MKRIGRETQCKVKYQIVDFYDMKKDYTEMIKQCEEYCLLLLEELKYKELEDTFLWLF